MTKKINILGMCIDNYTVREAMLQLDTYLNGTGLNIIKNVTMKQIVMAGENHQVRTCIEEADMSLIGEREILAETNHVSAQRMREIRDQDFMWELLKRIVRIQKQVFFLAMTREQVAQMQQFFTAASPRLMVAGSYAMEECVGDLDHVVNEINGVTPDIVFSTLPSPKEEEFLMEHKDKISAGVWYGIGEDYQKSSQMGHTFRQLLMRAKLRRTVSRYENGNKDGTRR
jgi:N-acetylglucosaminyldiphosphoundecaprenol N-acetyl-beta-D-mannosaminyltransferase